MTLVGRSHGIASRAMVIQDRFVVLVAFREKTPGLDSLLQICVPMQLSRPSFPMRTVVRVHPNAKARMIAPKRLLNALTDSA